MLNTILSWIAEAISELLGAIIKAFLGIMQVNLATIAGFFPGLVTGYRMFQAIAIGLTLTIAVWQLFKFFGGQLTEVKDTPVRILIRTAIAGWLIFFGGYFIEMAVNIAQIPYEAFSDMKSINGVTAAFSYEEFDVLKLFGPTVALGASGSILAYLFLVFLVGWNLLKLMLEVVERYLMVAVLAFAAPLFYPTMASQATSNIFRKFLGMFFGQCALLSISAWMLKVILSGFAAITSSTEGVIFHIIFMLAMCKIAQRVDTYMQTLGIGVATTGENILDDVIAGGRMIRGLGGSRSGGGAKETLGANTGGKLSRFGGAFGAASVATQGILQRNAQGQGFLKTFNPKQIGKDALDGTKIVPAAKAGIAGAKAAENSVVKGLSKSASKGIGDAPFAGKFDMTDAYREKAEDSAGAGQEGQSGNNQGAQNAVSLEQAQTEGLQVEKGKTAENGQPTKQVPKDAGIQKNQDGATQLNKAAQDAGLSWDNNHKSKAEGEKINQIKGSNESVGGFMAARINAGDNPEDLQAALKETAANGNPVAAEKALMQPNYELSGNDEVMSGLLENSFDTKEIIPDAGSGGSISNVSASNNPGDGVEGARQVTFDYTDANGNTSTYEVLNSAATQRINSEGKQVKKDEYSVPGALKQIQSKGSGQIYYARQVDVGQTQIGASNSGGTRTVQTSRAPQIKQITNQTNMPTPKTFRQSIQKPNNKNKPITPNGKRPGKK